MAAETKRIRFVKGGTFTHFTEQQIRKMGKKIAKNGWVQDDGSESAVPEVIIPAEVLKAKASLTQKLMNKEELDKQILNIESPVVSPIVDAKEIIAPVVKKAVVRKAAPKRKPTPKKK